MCYDISFTVNIKELSDYFPDLVFDGQLEIGFDGSHIMGHSYGMHPVIYRSREDQSLHAEGMEWGCIPPASMMVRLALLPCAVLLTAMAISPSGVTAML